MSRYAVLILLTAAGLAACSSGDEPTALPAGPAPATTTAAPTTAAATTTTPAPSASTGTRRSPIRWLGPAATGPAGPVQEATRAYWSMVVRLAEQPDPADPQITALSVSPQRDQLVTLYGNTRRQGITQRGPIDGSVTVSAATGTAATAVTCLDQSLVRVYDRAGKARPGSSGGIEKFTATLQRAGGAWKVSTVTDSGPCTIAR